MSSNTIPIFSPDGQLGDVPYERLHDALAAGAKVGVNIQAPDGSHGVIPADQLQAAQSKGARPIAYDVAGSQQQKQGFLSALGSDLKGMLTPTAQNPYPGMGQDQKVEAANQAAQQDQQRKAAGYSLPYRALAPVAQSVGVNVSGMEQAASQGDTGAVIGHAAAAATPVVTGAAIGALAPKVGPAIENTARDSAERMYQSALKPSTRLSPTKVANAVNTGLESGIPVSEAGLAKIGELIGNVNDSIKAQIDNGARQGVTIDPNAVASRLNDVRSRFSRQVAPAGDLNRIDAIKNDFMSGPGAGPIPADLAQSLKQGTYQQLKDAAYGSLKSAEIESQKALARGIKEELAAQFPELKDLNAKDSAFYGLEPLLEKAVQRISNHQLGGIGTPITAGAAKAVTGSNAVAGVAGALKAIVDNPNVKSRLAIMMNRASKGNVTLPMAQSRIAAYSSALGQSVPSANSEVPENQSPSQ